MRTLAPIPTPAALSVAALAAMAMLAGLGGCESTSALGRVEVVYHFENVRQTPSLDEWSKVRQILNARASRPVEAQETGAFSAPGVTVRSYRVAAVLPSVRALDKVQADLEELAEERVGGSRIQFSLAGIEATYRSNVVAAGVQVTIAGVASPGFMVRIYTDASSPPVEVAAGRNGVWSAKLAVIPESRWVYGASIDPAGVTAPRYFRVDVSTQKQEDLDESQFRGMIPQTAPPRPTVESRGSDADRTREEQNLRTLREREEEQRRLRREADDKRRSTRPG